VATYLFLSTPNVFIGDPVFSYLKELDSRFVLASVAKVRENGAYLQSAWGDRFILASGENSWGVNIRAFNQLRPVSHLIETLLAIVILE
jgi:hypothetical protein